MRILQVSRNTDTERMFQWLEVNPMDTQESPSWLKPSNCCAAEPHGELGHCSELLSNLSSTSVNLHTSCPAAVRTHRSISVSLSMCFFFCCCAPGCVYSSLWLLLSLDVRCLLAFVTDEPHVQHHWLSDLFRVKMPQVDGLLFSCFWLPSSLMMYAKQFSSWSKLSFVHPETHPLMSHHVWF